ncbi:hypothetical protein ACI8B_30236 [Acinetobacter proteolyticus]|uniref:Uncharacterized protein n=1 Tax=Acinetobacter proteolyticus TaxID=1776741 RepID=A0A653K7C4_9GAMM|nr:hypothetical protein ACI8B_30236 [Acinetobacter proteolyticus]
MSIHSFVICVKMSRLKLEQLLFNSGFASDNVQLKGKNKLLEGQEVCLNSRKLDKVWRLLY